MRKRIETKLRALKQEFEKGRAEIEKMDKQRAYLQETMLRLSGAIQVLEELLADANETSALNTADSEQASAPTDEKKQKLPA